MATPATPTVDPVKKAALLQAAAQLEMFLTAFGEMPKRARNATQEMKDALVEWANS